MKISFAPCMAGSLGGIWQAALVSGNSELRSNLVSLTMLFEGNEKLRLFGPYAQKPKVTVDCGGADFIVGRAHASDHVLSRRASVSDFPELPVDVAQDLARRGCEIPQVEGVSERHNVLQGHFARRGQLDWAVLCLRGDTSIILVYWSGLPKSPAQLAPMDETITPSKKGYYRILQTVDGQFIRDRYLSSRGGVPPPPKPPSVIDHDGIDDGIYEKGSRVRYFQNGEWLELAGSD